MKTDFLFFLAVLFYCGQTNTFWEHDRAVSAAQGGDFKKSKNLLITHVQDNPDDMSSLFDLGVSSSVLNEHKEAAAYFRTVAEHIDASADLKERAYFNCGNTCVPLKELEKAIENYEQALKINPDNEKTKHNLEVVKKMLEQQKQEQQNQQDQQDKKENQDNQKKDQGSDKQEERKQESDKSKSDGGSNNDKQEEERQKERSEERSQKSDTNDERQQKDGSSDESDQKQDQQEKKNDTGHDDSPEKKDAQQSDNQDKEGQQEEQEKTGAHAQPQYDQEVMQILAAIDKRDARANKKLMAAQVKQAAGKYDKNQNNY